jgi:transposase InsO family protein
MCCEKSSEALRALTIVDVYTRESVAIEVGQSLKGEDVVRTLNRMKYEGRVPKFLFCDNGSEFTSQAMDLWAYRNGVKIDFSRPGKPTDNAFIESFNGTFRDECLNTNWFQTLVEAKQIIHAWREEYNLSRPHRSLGERTPSDCNLNQPKTNSRLGTKTLVRSECRPPQGWAGSFLHASPRMLRLARCRNRERLQRTGDSLQVPAR